ncbi:hypothetical protein A7A08_02148 [Methyloligella halotolerans]|uniref:Uncharacterized protein n=1 Tax=Methyloligella halotolerans TaxID=1177755 RepID=A0A1E2RXA2_9HYPH|nr:hypothetical protein [Methyloligella halotolerans]ODA66851.1 hypothetical protein A7A08_02148 [Methyloligella halotolerans]
MISLAQRVIHALVEMDRGDVEFALQDAAIAVDVSAKRMFPDLHPRNGSRYKRFLEEYFWVIELMAFGGIDIQKSSFASIPIPNVSKPTLADVIYHLVRCNIIHEGGLPENIYLRPDHTIHFAKGVLGLPTQLVFALLSAVVFSRVNANEQSQGEAFLSYEDTKFLIADSWGREELLKPLFEKHVKCRVILSDTSFKDV